MSRSRGKETRGLFYADGIQRSPCASIDSPSLHFSSLPACRSRERSIISILGIPSNSLCWRAFYLCGPYFIFRNRRTRHGKIDTVSTIPPLFRGEGNDQISRLYRFWRSLVLSKLSANSWQNQERTFYLYFFPVSLFVLLFVFFRSISRFRNVNQRRLYGCYRLSRFAVLLLGIHVSTVFASVFRHGFLIVRGVRARQRLAFTAASRHAYLLYRCVELFRPGPLWLRSGDEPVHPRVTCCERLTHAGKTPLVTRFPVAKLEFPFLYVFPFPSLFFFYY